MSKLHGTHQADKRKLPPRLLFILIIAFLCLLMQFNGLIHVWPNLLVICNSLMLEPMGLQLVTRILARFINNDEELVDEIHDEIDKFYKNEEKDRETHNILTSRLNFIEILLKSYMMLNFFCFITPAMTALILSWSSNEFILFVPFWLPFTDPTTANGFAINAGLMIFYSVLFYELLISQDLFFILYTMQVIPMGDIFIQKMRKLNDKLSEVRKNQKLAVIPKCDTLLSLSQTHHKRIIQEHSINEVEKDIIHLIKSYNNYNSFISLIFPYMHYTTFIAISTNAIGIGLAILVANFISISIGISVMLIFTVQVLMTCFQGTTIAHQNQKILNESWNFSWYKLSVPMQRVWLQFIHQCQHPNELEIAIFGILDMECFTNVMNVAYSYFMFILNFTK